MRENYFDQVYDVVALIPEGKVSTYGAIADYLTLGSARMVGWALKQSLTAQIAVPAHRVVNSKGELSGRHGFGHPQMMEELLKLEGVEVANDKVVNFAATLWKPADHL